MTEIAPPWLLKMRSMNGLSEKPGAADNTKILAMADEHRNYFPRYEVVLRSIQSRFHPVVRADGR